MLRALVIATMLLAPAIASGDRLIYGPGDAAPEYGFVGDVREDGLIMARQVVPPSASSAAPRVAGVGVQNVAFAQSRTVFLNKNGVTLSPGSNDSRTNHSTVVSQQTAIQGWTAADATTWSDTVSCMRELFSRWDITVVDADPGASVPHIEAVFGGTPQQVGLDPAVAGVSPFTTDCSIIENSIVFTFTNANSFTAREACEIMAQEVAHSFGLDHELLAADPMTYLSYTGSRSFQDQAVSCGESTARQCGINGNVCWATQNSVQMLTQRVGLADAIMPTIEGMSPNNGATVPPGFQVKVVGSDNNGVTGATLKIDGAMVDSATGAGPFAFTTPSLPEGMHTFSVDITDGKNIKTETRSVTVKIGAPPPQDDLPDAESPFGEVSGGCSTGGGSGSVGLVLALGALLVTPRRRRRRR